MVVVSGLPKNHKKSHRRRLHKPTAISIGPRRSKACDSRDLCIGPGEVLGRPLAVNGLLRVWVVARNEISPCFLAVRGTFLKSLVPSRDVFEVPVS